MRNEDFFSVKKVLAYMIFLEGDWIIENLHKHEYIEKYWKKWG